MDYTESHHTRHILVEAQSGDSLPDDLVLALEVADVKSARLSGTGRLRSAELVVTTMTGEARRTLQGRSELITLEGAFAKAPRGLELWATLAFETDFGHEVVAGRLVKATVESLEALVVALDAAPARPGAATEPSRAAAPPAPSPSSPATHGPGAAGEASSPPVPPARYKTASHDSDEYPEPGDLVTHFHFGECTVIESDGERIRLRQGPEGRVREVALSMLRIDPPTVDAETGKRHFELRRKN